MLIMVTKISARSNDRHGHRLHIWRLFVNESHVYSQLQLIVIGKFKVIPFKLTSLLLYRGFDSSIAMGKLSFLQVQPTLSVFNNNAYC